MAKRQPEKQAQATRGLTRDRVLAAALQLADADGIDSLSMRRLGQALGVEAMSLYNHVANKDAILDAIVDLVVAEIDLPAEGDNWKAAMHHRAMSARDVLLRHPWAPALIESRLNPGPARLRYFNAVIGCLRRGGFSIALAYRAFLTLDSYIYGFTLQEVNWPFEQAQRPDVVARMAPQIPADEYPWMMEMMQFVMQPGPRRKRTPKTQPPQRHQAYAAEYQFGLELILDGLERSLAAG